MKKRIRKFGALFLSASMVLGIVGEPLTTRKMKSEVKAVETERPTLQLWYDEPAKDWESEALPIGNGRIGAMVFGGVDSDKIQVNEETVWSGGPGASSNYDGGDNSYSESDTHAALQSVRTQLQDMVTEFSKNNAAHYDEDGDLVTSDYPDLLEKSSFAKALEKLKGEKTYFGSYQTLGNIVFNNPTVAAAKIVKTETNANTASSEAERVGSLFDGDYGTKWFTGFGYGKTATIAWQYEKKVKTSSYSLVSGNDSPERDPADFVLYGSNDGSTYEKIDSQTGVKFSDRKECKTFDLESKVEYQYYKIEISKNKDGNNGAFQLTEIELEGAKLKETPYTDYKRMTDVNQAVEHVQYTQDNVQYTRDYFVSNPGNVMVVRLSADKAGKITRAIEVNTEHSNNKITVDEANATITMTGQSSGQKSTGLKFAQQIKVIAENGTVTKSDDSTLLVDSADSVMLVMSAATNYQVDEGTTYNYFSKNDPLTEVKANVNAAAKKDYDTLFAAHVKDYRNLFDRVTLNIGAKDVPEKTTDQLLKDYGSDNTAIEDRYLETLFYQYGRYLLIASSRENSQLPANLQGIWAQGLNPMWNSDYHTNINLQMNYWLAEQTNLAECHETDINYINSLVKKGEVTAKKYYCKQDGSDVRGWVIHHENNIWGNTNPAETTTAFYFPAAAAWMCQDIWDTYEFNEDVDFLKNNYNTLLQAALFWVDNLWTDSRDGTLVANPSYSPEHGVYSIGCSSDQALIWELFEEVKKASAVLGKSNDSEVKEVLSAQKKLYMPKVGLGGQLAEWKDETTLEVENYDSHRHQNQLSILHPGTYVIAGRSEKDDELCEAAKVTLNKRGDGGTGWSKAWKINMWARLRDGSRAHKLLSEQIKGSTLTNLFDTHAPYQIDGNFGATSGMTEMLLQSQGGYIEPLAALPSSWESGSVSGIKARGNFELNEEWDEGILTGLTIASNSGKECQVKYSKISEAKVVKKSDGTEVKTTKVDDSDDMISFQTEAGETYLFTELSTDIKVSQETKFIGGTIDNLYSSSVVASTGAQSNDGVFFTKLGSCSLAEKLGIQKNDVITQIGSTKVLNVKQLLLEYDKYKEGDTISFKVWRKNQSIDVSYQKTSNDNAKVVPGLIQAEDADKLVGSLKTESCADVDGGENIGYIENGDYAIYRNINFSGKPTKFVLRSSAFNNATPVVSVYLDSLEGTKIASLTCKNTGEYQAYVNNECELTNMTTVTGVHDVYVVFGGNQNVNWFAFEGDDYTAPNPTPKPANTPKPAPSGEGYKEVPLSLSVDLVNGGKQGDAKSEAQSDGKSVKLTFPYQYADSKIALGTEKKYDLSDYTKVTLTVTASQQFRVAFFDSKGKNITGKDDWEYLGGGSLKNETVEINLAKYDLEDVARIAIGANCDDFQPIIIHDITFTGKRYELIPSPSPEPSQLPTQNPVVTPTPTQTSKPGVTPIPSPGTGSGMTDGMQVVDRKVKVAKVKSLKGKRSGKKLTVTYKKINGVKGYQIVIATNKKFTKGVKKYTTSKTKYVIKKLSKKKKYYVRVRAYKKVDSTKKYGPYSKAMKK